MIERFLLFSRILFHSTLVTAAQSLIGAILFKEVYHMELMDKLIKVSERRILRKAAKLLVRDDLYDRYFFNECLVRADRLSLSSRVVYLGESYAIVHTSGPVNEKYVRIDRVKKCGGNRNAVGSVT